MCPLLAILTAEQSQPLMRPPGPTSAPRTKARVLPSLQHVTPAAALVPWRSLLRGCPNLQHFATFNVSLELRSLPSAGVTRLRRYCGPLRHPIAPSLTVTGLRLVVTTDHAIGLPVLRALSLCACCRHYPGAATVIKLCSSAQPYQPSPKRVVGFGLRIGIFEGLLGVHLRYGLHTRAVTVFRDTLSEGFSQFVTSLAAPVASGWSGCRVELAPTGKAPPCHGDHNPMRSFRPELAFTSKRTFRGQREEPLTCANRVPVRQTSPPLHSLTRRPLVSLVNSSASASLPPGRC